MFCKLDVHRKSILTLALSQNNCKIVRIHGVNQAPELQKMQVLYEL